MIKIFITYFALIALLALPNSPLGPYSNMGLFLLMIMLHLAVRENYLKLGFKIGADIKEKLMLAWLQMHLDKDTIKQIADTSKAEVEVFKKTGKDVIIPLTTKK
jgi:hypothetical protein